MVASQTVDDADRVHRHVNPTNRVEAHVDLLLEELMHRRTASPSVVIRLQLVRGADVTEWRHLFDRLRRALLVRRRRD